MVTFQDPPPPLTQMKTLLLLISEDKLLQMFRLIGNLVQPNFVPFSGIYRLTSAD